MKKYTESELANARKLQAILLKIDQKIPVFFNITVFVNSGLVREFGKTADDKPNWVLTERAKRFLNVQI